MYHYKALVSSYFCHWILPITGMSLLLSHNNKNNENGCYEPSGYPTDWPHSTQDDNGKYKPHCPGCGYLCESMQKAPQKRGLFGYLSDIFLDMNVAV